MLLLLWKLHSPLYSVSSPPPDRAVRAGRDLPAPVVHSAGFPAAGLQYPVQPCIYCIVSCTSAEIHIVVNDAYVVMYKPWQPCHRRWMECLARMVQEGVIVKNWWFTQYKQGGRCARMELVASGKKGVLTRGIRSVPRCKKSSTIPGRGRWSSRVCRPLLPARQRVRNSKARLGWGSQQLGTGRGDSV